MNKTEQIEYFWNDNPCGIDFVNGNVDKIFFEEYDKFKYNLETHIPSEIKDLNVKDKLLLEIGMGQGAEAQLLIQNGCLYNGIDFTDSSIERVRKRFDIFKLNYKSITKMNAEDIKFENDTFDFVFSHGVIHHSPDIRTIISEIKRVMKPNGRFAIMVYHKNSINYQISIKILRRIGVFLLFIPGFDRIVSILTHEPIGRLNKHKANFKKNGLSYLRINNFIHKATDGPDNIYSSVFSEYNLKILFSGFKNLKFKRFYFNDRHFPFLRYVMPRILINYLAGKYGWHIWIYGEK